MSVNQNAERQETSGRRTLLNIVLFMFGTIALLLVVKYLFGM